ncbi:acyl-CoA N-acyltransferase [Backusella circina FSU 941]|nr:acyl-CoA N-acyltransferase [Backusella circina FSU 941]
MSSLVYCSKKMVRDQIFSLQELEPVYQIRRAVYVYEHGYKEDVVVDYKDALSETWVATGDSTDKEGNEKKSVPIGTIRLFPLPNNMVKLGRLAVLPEARGMGIGKKLMVLAIEHAKRKSYDTIVLHAYSDKHLFYQKFGFKLEEGDDQEFQEKGITLVRLWMRQLQDT